MKALLLVFAAAALSGQTLAYRWEELTAEDFVGAVAQARGTCVLPFGIVEKHGPSGPLGTDLIDIRAIAAKAAEREYAVVFPSYYFGQIFEARHQPGTIAYSTNLQLQLMQETLAEMGRNGCKKIVIANGHGGNSSLVGYVLQIQLESQRDYVVYSFSALGGAANLPAAAQASKPGVDGHAGEAETAMAMAAQPGLAHPERAGRQSGANQARLDLPAGVSTGIGWYAMYPNHYQGDAAGATAARGTALIEDRAAQLALALKAIKADEAGPRLQREFFENALHPLDTKQ